MRYAICVAIIDDMKDMLGRRQVISSEAALKMLLDALPAKTPDEIGVSISESIGMICADDVNSAEDLPHFARSTVDGYAVAAEDTFGASEAMPAYITLSKEIFMGETAGVSLSRGKACKIPTGGMLPEGSDSVVMFEHVQKVDETMIEVLRPVVPGENVIQPGEDVKKGERVLRKGMRIRPQDIGACAGIGLTEIKVYKRLRASIISSGDEIVAADASPAAGQVRDINSYVLAAMLSSEGAVPLRKGIFRDDYAALRAVLESSLIDSDVVILSGGTSVGTKDMIAAIVDEIGDPGVIFHGVSLKPGKPMIGGLIGTVPVFGLPGHPAAVSVCFDVFIRPVLARLSGLREKFPGYGRKTIRARLTRNVSSSPGREEHLRVMIEEREDGPWAVPVLGKSGLIATLVKADGTIVIPLNVNGVEAGEVVDVRLF
jgi:molybdopterin molybdotransferase